jgi:hypothetical protein
MVRTISPAMTQNSIGMFENISPPRKIGFHSQVASTHPARHDEMRSATL